MAQKHGFILDIEKQTIENTDFRRVLYTAEHSQLVLMSIKPGEEIGEEVHEVDQFLRFEKGEGKVILNGKEEHPIRTDMAVVVPAGTLHNVINTGSEDLKLYTIYTPPEHEDGKIHHTKEEAEKDEKEGTDHFDGETTE